MTKSVKYSARYYIVQGHFSQGKLYCFHKSQIDLNGSLPVLRQARSRGMAFAKLPMPRIPFPALSLTGASGVGRVWWSLCWTCGLCPCTGFPHVHRRWTVCPPVYGEGCAGRRKVLPVFKNHPWGCQWKGTV